MSDYLHEAWKKAMNELTQQLLDDVKSMRPTLVGMPTREAPQGGGYVFYDEWGKRPDVIDSTATVIDENVKALPAPEVQE